jgi:hypothetical protein
MRLRAAVALAATLVVGVTPAALAADRTAGPQRSVDRATIRAELAARMTPAERAAVAFVPSVFECIARGNPAANVFLDCDDAVLPDNEQDIEVANDHPRHMIASANDYDSNGDEFYTSYDGGRTWKTGDMSLRAAVAGEVAVIGSDPVTAWDPVRKVWIHSSLNFGVTEQGETTNGHLVVSLSKDGVTWGKPVIVARGFGADTAPVQVFNDKEWIVSDQNPSSPYYGRAYLTWSRFLAHNGNYVESPIWEAHSDDGGKTWSRPKEISGSSRTCTFQEAGPARQCDEDQGSVGTVGPDGTLYVAFENGQHEAAWEAGDLFESQYMVVSSKNGGRAFSPPVHVVDMEDGTRDFPINVDGRQTLTGYQLRIPTYGNIVASSVDGTLYLTFTDNRAGRHDVDRPVTDTNVFVMWSRDGVRWHGPRPVSSAEGDQWFPWADVNPKTGKVGVVYNTRGHRNGDLFNVALAEGGPGAWTRTRISTRPSNPVTSLFFQALVRRCFKCATFHGDYINLDYGSDGAANAVWTDHRRFIDLGPDGNGFTENSFYARR